MGKSERTKGHNFEREIAREQRIVFPEARRGLQYRDPRECDVEGTPLRQECKRQKRFAYSEILAALMQCKRDAEAHEDDRLCIAITKQDRRPAIVSMTHDTFLSLVERHFYKPTEDAEIIPFPTKEQR